MVPRIATRILNHIDIYHVIFIMLAQGLEPRTYGPLVGCSTQVPCRNSVFYLTFNVMHTGPRRGIVLYAYAYHPVPSRTSMLSVG
jgi:hypothetical protein